jgi:hypothetical protein
VGRERPARTYATALKSVEKRGFPGLPIEPRPHMPPITATLAPPTNNAVLRLLIRSQQMPAIALPIASH